MVVLKTDFSHCPLKKRPLSMCYEASEKEQTEPHDLSLKCSRTAPTHLHPRENGVRGVHPEDAHTPPARLHATPADALHLPPNHVLAAATPTTGARVPERHGAASPMGVEGSRVSKDSHTAMTYDAALPHPFIRPSPPHLPPVPACVPKGGLGSHFGQTFLGYSGVPPPVARVEPFLGASSPVVPKHQHDIATSRTSKTSPSAMDVPLSVAETIKYEQPQCSAPMVLAAPHRPWLSEGPLRPIQRPLPEVNIPLPPMRPRPLLTGSPGLWAGVMPLPWTVSPLLPQPRPHSPGRPRLECCSPGSESASSEGSSSGGRGDSRYSCAECNKSYSTYSGLSKHKQFHCSALGAKSFGCKHCDKVYTSLGALKMHIRTHTLPCKCHLCGKAFSRPWLLQGHIRTHTGEKPFQCSQCDRCFADRSNLRAHLQTHADIKKYACPTCHKTFSRMSLLNKHTEAACPTLHRRTVP